jgi:hypothetical protein
MAISSLTASFSSILLAISPFFVFGAYESSSEGAAGVAFLFVCLAFICIFAVMIFLFFIPLMKIFKKAGQPGWFAFVPILNSCTIAHIVGRDWWWGIIPILNILPMFELAKAFGKSEGFGIGLVLLPYVFVPMLGFGNAQYQLQPRPPLF